MTPEQFEEYGILHFTPAEVIATGANLGDVQARLMQHYEYFRRDLGQAVRFVKNGLTSGGHSCQLHPLGLAGDGTTKPYDPVRVFKSALNARFRGIGLYWTEAHGWRTFHLDLREEFGFWLGVKRKRQRKWRYYPLLADPVRILKTLLR